MNKISNSNKMNCFLAWHCGLIFATIKGMLIRTFGKKLTNKEAEEVYAALRGIYILLNEKVRK